MRRVLVVHLHLEHAQPVHPGDERRQSGLARTASSDEQQVALRLAEDAVDAEDVVEDLIEEHERHVQLLLVEDLQTRLGVLAQRLLLDRHVVLRQPVAVEDGALEGALAVDVGEVFQTDTVDVLARPQTLFIFNKSGNKRQ